MTISQHLDDLGIDYIEGGWQEQIQQIMIFFLEILNFKKQINCFGMTRRPGRSADNDPGLNALINSVQAVLYCRKVSTFHVKNALEISKRKFKNDW